MSDLMTIKEASEWATQHLNKKVTTSNISYLIQYGRIKRISKNGTTYVDRNELIRYYQHSYNGRREIEWKNRLGDDLDWALSFDHLKEADTTKHVHRLHPYKGKFIPQLVEYFIDTHTDDFKKEVYFNKGDIILDPFCGSGTTLVQSNELGIHAIGIDVSAFNVLISNVKIQKHNLVDIVKEIQKITLSLRQFLSDKKTIEFDNLLLEKLNKFNTQFFPVPEYKYKLQKGEVNEDEYGRSKEKEFLRAYRDLLRAYKVTLQQEESKTFLDKWYIQPIREEIEFVFREIKKIKNQDTKKVLSIILSRTIRSCRATTHADLATLKDPISAPYYCSKHGKVCKPLFSILKWWGTYSKDTVKRMVHFDKIRTGTYQFCLTGDSRLINIFDELEEKHSVFAQIAKKQKIKGIFSSPPYVGLIDYHEQHAYAYDLFGFKRSDHLEIGPLCKGQGNEARESYVQGISEVLINCVKFLSIDYDVFLVANDKYNLYPSIAERAGMKITNRFRRPVLNRTEKDKGAYSETIFHLKPKK